MSRMQSSMRSPMVSKSLSSASSAGLGWEGMDLIASTTLTSAASSFSFSELGEISASGYSADVNIFLHMKIFGYFKNDGSECDILFEWAGDATTSKYISATIDSVSVAGTPVRCSGTYTSSLAGMRMGHLYANDSCVIDVVLNNMPGGGYPFCPQSYCGTHDDDNAYVNWSGGIFWNAGGAIDLTELEVKATAGSFAAGTTLAIIGNRYGYGD